MREVKFRGLIPKTKKWVYGDVLHYAGNAQIWEQTEESHNFIVIPETVGQFTGLKDKNGKEIYEGDILQMTTLSGRGFFEYKTDVIFDEGSWIIKGEDTSEYDTYLYAYVNCTTPIVEMEVIGNIHQNRELLNS